MICRKRVKLVWCYIWWFLRLLITKCHERRFTFNKYTVQFEPFKTSSLRLQSYQASTSSRERRRPSRWSYVPSLRRPLEEGGASLDQDLSYYQRVSSRSSCRTWGGPRMWSGSTWGGSSYHRWSYLSFEVDCRGCKPGRPDSYLSSLGRIHRTRQFSGIKFRLCPSFRATWHRFVYLSIIPSRNVIVPL